MATPPNNSTKRKFGVENLDAELFGLRRSTRENRGNKYNVTYTIWVVKGEHMIQRTRCTGVRVVTKMDQGYGESVNRKESAMMQ